MAILLALSATGCNSTSSTTAQAANSKIKAEDQRKAAPEFALKDADGRTVRLSEYKGKVVLLNFWATWCGPCRLEMPWFVDFERTYKNDGFAVVGVSLDEDGWSAIKPFITEIGVNYRVLQGDDMAAEQYGGVESLPTTFIIDREGRIAATHVGLVSKNVFESEIQSLLGKQAGGLRFGVPAFHLGAE
ncbi:MAG: TlpA family protein disulfide reductase [Bryobacterales bacterium]|nr:TlpA family protein disulfide reductase [Bryobacterales bacterium]